MNDRMTNMIRVPVMVKLLKRLRDFRYFENTRLKQGANK